MPYTTLSRPFEAGDYPRLAEIRNLWELEPVTAEELEEEDSRADPNGIRRRVMLTEADGTTVGYAMTMRESDDPEGQWWVTIGLDLPYRGQHRAEDALRPLLEFAYSNGGEVARDYFRSDCTRSRRFAERLGATYVEDMFESLYDLNALDPALLSAFKARLAEQGVAILRFSDLEQSEENLRRLHALYVPVEADMPGIYRGWHRPYENFIREVVRKPSFRPDGVFIAAQEDHWIGLAIVQEKDGKAFNQTTGVLNGFRGRGIASGLKAHSIEWAKTIGAQTIRTYNHSTNEAMRAINVKLGYTPQPGWTCYELNLARYFEGAPHG
jgi:RimJ/RimL family protein N-acetyltransferase